MIKRKKEEQFEVSLRPNFWFTANFKTLMKRICWRTSPNYDNDAHNLLASFITMLINITLY